MTATARKQPGKRLSFVVWQFVRVMVELEKTGMKSQAYRAWRDQWQELDRKLGRLGQSNRPAYSKLMMEEEVVIDKVTDGEAADTRRALDSVIRKINIEIQKAEPEDEILPGLEFELAELAELRDEVRKLAPPAARPNRRRRPKKHRPRRDNGH